MMKKVRTLVIGNYVPALMALAITTMAPCEMASAQSSSATTIFNYPNGFAGAGGAIQTVGGNTSLNGSGILLTNSGAAEHSAGAAWYKTQQNISSFTTQFTFQLGTSGLPSTEGFTFAVQNTNPVTNAIGWTQTFAVADANGCGFGAYDLPGQGPILNSVGVKFDLSGNGQHNYPSGGHPSATGLYINGGPWSSLDGANDLNPYGINLYSGDVFAVNIVYDGALLTMTIRDTTTNAQGRYVWPVNIPAAISSDGGVTPGSSAWVGFTAGTLPPVNQNILTWSFSQGYNTRLAAPTFSAPAGSYASAQTVSINGTNGATIYYTTNGLLPTSSSTRYTGPITVSANEVLQAVAIESGFTDSLVTTGNYEIGTSNSVNFPSGFGSNDGVILTGYAKLNGSTIQLTDSNSAGGEAAAAWYAAPVNVQKFTTNFALQFTSASGNGMTFTIQNQPASTSSPGNHVYVSGGPTTYANDGAALGYGYVPAGTGTGTTGGILSSVAIKFDLTNNSTGLFTGGVEPTAPQTTITGVNLSSGNPLNVGLTYNGSTLAMTITDTKTSGSFSTSWPINIPATVGGNNGYVGFTAATGYSVANQSVLSWTYAGSAAASTPVPAAPTNLRVQ